MKFRIGMLVIGLIVGSGTAVAATSSLNLSNGDTGIVNCGGTRLSATRLSATKYSLPCTGSTTTTVPVTTTTTVPIPTTTTIAPPSGSYWIPGNQLIEWQWELDHALNLSSQTDVPLVNAVYDIDGFDNPASTVTSLHNQGDHVICYIDVGTYEPGRSDSSQFPSGLLGNGVSGWPGERWLNTSSSGPYYSTLQAIMTARFKTCHDKGFDAVEPDNIDGSENNTGFALTNAQSIAYAKWFASAVHSFGMSVAQKNFVDQSAALVGSFDFVINEQCSQYGECNSLAPYPNANKAVFEAEYTPTSTSSFCPAANAANRNAVLFNINLDGKTRVSCR